MDFKTLNYQRVSSPDVFLFIKQGKYIFPHKHNHTFWEFIFVERGNVLNRIEDTDRIITKNELCVLRPETVHTVLERTDAPLLLVNFEVETEWLNKLCKSLGLCSADKTFPDPATYLSFTEEETAECMKLLNKTQDQTLSKEVKSSFSKLLVSKFISKAVLQKQSPNISAKSPLVSKILAELENKENFPLSIEEICKKSTYTHEYVTRLFKKEKLAPPSKIFQKNKLAYACTFLSSSEMNIIDVAELCGIYSLSYFNKIFKNTYGVSPSNYRKNALKSLHTEEP